jgi:hypothetical protein
MPEFARANKRSENIARQYFLMECFVFRDEKFLGWDCFYKGSFSVGNDKGSDIVLEDLNISDVRAVVECMDNKVIVTNKSFNKEICVNGRPVSTCILEPLDVLRIGPFILKIKIKRATGFGLNNNCETNKLNSKPSHMRGMDRRLGADLTSGEDLLKDEHVKEENIVEATSQRNQSQSYVIERDCNGNGNEKELISEEIDEEKSIEARKTPLPETESKSYYVENDEEEDEDDEAERDLPLFLKEKLSEDNSSEPVRRGAEVALKVMKFKDDHIFDVRYLDKKEKYEYVNGKIRFCIARNRGSDQCYFFFNRQFTGQLRSSNASNKDIADLCIPKNMHRKRKGIYRSLVPENGSVLLTDGYYHYFIQRSIKYASPKIADIPKPRDPFYKNLIKSVSLHVFLMVLTTIFISLPEIPQHHEQESRFVHINTDKLKKAEPVPPKKKKVKRVKPITKKVKPVIKKVKPVIKKVKPITKKVIKPKKAYKKKVVSRAIKRKFVKKGNVKKRNINKAGILGLIGNTIGLKPSEALASVTNLDAVSSQQSREENFKVGGIVSKLDSPEIEIPAGGIVKTKGSTQVLRSAGSGMVAALKEGTTGKKRVKAMVSVALDKNVRVQGGMSREAVKRVIDQHMDEITFCYENALMDDPSITGSIVFEWKILLSGMVGEVGIKTSFVRSNAMHTCIKRAIKSWQFPEPRNTEVIVSYPFVFDIVGF